GFENAAWCERIAIVTDIAWVRLTVKAIRFLIPGEIRVFDTSETAEARAWITARPGSRADLANAAPAPVRARRLRAQRPRRRDPAWAAQTVSISPPTAETVSG
ncbi:MAG TPA: STAS/SEC14 domain-containing protein, partial [Stellaceae bacterium]|nr:STAS/SEC14 domain-containing protein [Stellaceae bacterium]